MSLRLVTENCISTVIATNASTLLTRKKYGMKIPTGFKQALWGAVGGAAVLAILGFTWGGWVTGKTAEVIAQDRASMAVVAALAPICAKNFRSGQDAPAQLVKLKKAQSWEQANFVEEGGWSKFAGAESNDRAIAAVCAEMIMGAN